MDLFDILPNGQVLKVEQVGDNIVRTGYDMQFHVQLTVDKPSIKPDGIDKAIVTAKVFNYLGELQAENRAIVFDVEGVQTIIDTAAGVASIEVTSEVAGEIDIMTDCPNMRNAGVFVNAQA